MGFEEHLDASIAKVPGRIWLLKPAFSQVPQIPDLVVVFALQPRILQIVNLESAMKTPNKRRRRRSDEPEDRPKIDVLQEELYEINRKMRAKRRRVLRGQGIARSSVGVLFTALVISFPGRKRAKKASLIPPQEWAINRQDMWS